MSDPCGGWFAGAIIDGAKVIFGAEHGIERFIHHPATVRLGRKPKRIDPRTLKMAKYLTGALPAPKSQIDWLSAVPSFPMYGNDVHGDCTIAAIGHMVQIWSANAGSPVTPSLDDVMTVYNILSPNDDGCVLLDVLNYWRQNTICGIKLGAYASVNPQNQAEVESSLEIFGGLYAGALLPIAAQSQSVWDVSSGPNAEPDSWGGHCIPFGKYNGTQTGLVTWGAVKYSTWAWNAQYVDELYALISPDWLNGNGQTPEGLDINALNADLKLVTA